MTREDALTAVFLQRDLFDRTDPIFPLAALDAAVTVSEQASAIIDAAVEYKWRGEKVSLLKMKVAAIRTAAMALRFLEVSDKIERDQDNSEIDLVDRS